MKKEKTEKDENQDIPTEEIPEKQAEESAEPQENETQHLRGQLIRLKAEFDNYRKRTQREKIEMSKTAEAEVVTNILPILDDLERAYSAIDLSDDSLTATKDGIGLILNKFINILTQAGLERIKAVGEQFNTDFHEAITNIPAPSPELKGKIVDVIEKGYLLNGKVIRFAKVVVGS